MAYDIYCAFDLEKHKQTYVQYLEVVILEDGTVEYAVPSHQEKLIALRSFTQVWRWVLGIRKAGRLLSALLFSDFLKR